MLTAIVSTFALALTFGPQLQVSLQAALDETVPSEVQVEEDLSVEDTIVDSNDVEPEIDEPVEALEETIISSQDIMEPEASTPVPMPEASGTIVDVSETEETTPTPQASGEVDAAEWPTLLESASAALADAKTASGKFIQTNGDGSIVTGTFALNRPGRMRFDYDDPTPILIVSDGTTVAMEDSELETVDRIPIGATPLGLILSTQLNVDEDIEVLSILRNEDRIGIRVSDASGELEGTLTMVFDAATYDLLGWLAVDGNFQTTVVDLMDVEKNVRVDPRLFRLNEDDDEEDER